MSTRLPTSRVTALGGGAVLFISLLFAAVIGSRSEGPMVEESIRDRTDPTPYLTLRDAVELSGSEASRAPSTALTSADFDEDGVADLVACRTDDSCSFRSGNIDLLFPNGPGASERRDSAGSQGEAFRSEREPFVLPISARYLVSGDFDRDGHQDLLAAAENGNALFLMSGDGHGAFRLAQKFDLPGMITSLAAGQIGRADNVTDIVVGIEMPDGAAALLVYEHPEGAFARPPEVFKLNSRATAIVLGEFDEDSLFDIAVACGKTLVIVHERMQIYPWDDIPDLHLKRPPAQVGERDLDFEILGLAAGKFDQSRRESIAALDREGDLHLLRPPAPAAKPQTKSNAVASMTPPGLGLPSHARLAPYRVLDTSRLRMTTRLARSVGRTVIRKGPDEGHGELLETMTRQQPAELKEPRPPKLPLKVPASFYIPASRIFEWTDTVVTRDSPFQGASATGDRNLLMTARVSASSFDDILVIDRYGRKISLASFQPPTDIRRATNTVSISSIDPKGSPTAVLPLRLNGDALDDLVVLRDSLAQPSIVLTAPANVYTVNDAGDGPGNCGGAGTCTLRAAIQAANSSPGSTINFNIVGGGVQTISPLSELPVVTQPVTIDATTQPGYSGLPLIEIKGNNFSAGQAIDGLKIRASNCVIRGLAINQFPHASNGDGSFSGGNGLTLESTVNFPNNDHNFVEGNFLGTDPTGTLDRGNASTGLNVFDSDHDTIGGTTSLARNVISGNGTASDRGVGIEVVNGNNDSFLGNYIGVNASSTGKLPNSAGVLLSGANNTIGGETAGSGNVISGNGELRPGDPANRCDGSGLTEALLFAQNATDNLTLNNLLQGNKFGTDASGTAAMGNCSSAIITNPVSQMVAGSNTVPGRNIISGNGDVAIDVDGTNDHNLGLPDGGFTAFSGNNIGTDVTGTAAIPNDNRNGCTGFCTLEGIINVFPNDGALVNFGAPGGTTPGGACTGFCNLISGNGEADGGTMLREAFGGSVLVIDSYFGTNAGGTAGLPNQLPIISLHGSTFVGIVGADQNGPKALGNVLSGNGGTAVFLDNFDGDGTTSSCQANLIGTDPSGNNAIPNGSDPNQSFPTAVFAQADPASSVIIGGADNALQRNVISGNRGSGLQARGHVSVLGNYVGTNSAGTSPLPNTENGIGADTGIPGMCTIGGSSVLAGNLVENNAKDGINIDGTGSSCQIAGNTISNNGGAGIHIKNSSNNQIGGTGGANTITNNTGAGVRIEAGVDNDIQRNSIYNNGALGIDLGPSGVTLNDANDSDSGANNLQNYPLLGAPVVISTGETEFAVSLNSAPNTTYRLDFYSVPQPDGSSHGQGKTFLSDATLTTNASGRASFAFGTSSLASGDLVAATATDPNGNTSEFSCLDGRCCSEVPPGLAGVPSVPEVTCLAPYVVNVTTDDEDALLGDHICDTDLNTPGNQCSLRAALQEAGSEDGNLITFDIPAATDGGCNHTTDICTIAPAAALPVISKQMVVDATTQAGFTIDTPKVEISGVNAGNGVSGLTINSTGSKVKGFIINRFDGNGVLLNGGSDNAITACFIGTTSTGNGGAGNKGDGVSIGNSSKNTIGGKTAAERNVISANGDEGQHTGNGITVTGDSAGNSVFGCYIGTNANGNAALGNRHDGVQILAGETTIGQDIFPGGSSFAGSKNLPSGNVISGNVAQGVEIVGVDAHVDGNLIGTDKTGTVAIPNQTGVLIKDFLQTRPGLLVLVEVNLISGNTGDGVRVVNSGPRVQIFQNNIGTDDTTETPLGNQNGVRITDGSHDVLVGTVVACGGSTTETCGHSIISGNREAGVLIVQGQGAAPFHNYVEGAVIGGNRSLNLAVPNATGIDIQNSTQNVIWDDDIDCNTTGVRISGPNGGSNALSSDRIGNSGSNTNGVVINSSGNSIGLVAADSIVTFQFSNLISNNDAYGILIKRSGSEPAPTGNLLINNIVGTDPTGQTALPNGIGILLTDGAHDNLIGNGVTSIPNIISGNSVAGISLEVGAGGLADAPFHNFINGNLIGTNLNNANSYLAIPNEVGVHIQDSQQNLIQANTIVGSRTNGIDLLGANGGNNTVTGNHIGTDVNRQQLGNDVGILISSSNNLIGSANDFDDNQVIGGNNHWGILITGDGTHAPPTGNTITGNLIGTDGHIGLANQDAGVLVTEGASGNTIGQVGSGNVIAGNLGGSVDIKRGPDGSPSGNTVAGNRIGTDQSGMNAVANSGVSGVSIEDSDGNHIDHNIISALLNGVSVSGEFASGNLIRGNYVGVQVDGTTALGSLFNGILIANAAHNNTVGGPNDGDGNIIANNQKAVAMDDAGCCNIIDPNSIFANALIGIDLDNSGNPIPNDSGDPDQGPNNLQNFPEFVSAFINGSGDLILLYRVDSDPGNSNYGTSGLRVEFFKADASSSLQGQTFIGADQYTVTDNANPGHQKSFNAGNAAALGVSVGNKLVATATDADGNTSEFTSTNVGVVAAPTGARVSISGRVTKGGSPLKNAQITLTAADGTHSRAVTNSFGYYKLSNIVVGQTYILTASCKGYTIVNSARVITIIDELTDQDFTASP